jgi:hypothetical protein
VSLEGLGPVAEAVGFRHMRGLSEQRGTRELRAAP